MLFSKVKILLCVLVCMCISLQVLFAQDNSLSIVAVQPIGQTSSDSDYQAIAVLFSEDMIALEQIGEIEEDYFSFSIPITGRYVWVDTKILGFVPSQELPMMSTFAVTVKKGITSLAGNSLADDYTWEFKTALPHLRSYRPYNGQNNVGTKPNIVLEFNVNLNLDQVRNMVSIKSANSTFAYTVEKLTPDMRRELSIYLYYSDVNQSSGVYENVFVLTPIAELPKDSNITVAISGGNLNDNNIISTFNFNTHDDLKYIGQLKQSVNADFYPNPINIEFSTPIEPEEFFKHIEISPAVQMPSSDELSSYPRDSFSLRELKLKADSSYTVTVKKGLTDVFGQVLQSDVSVDVAIGSYSPNVYIPSGDGIIEAYEGRNLPITAINPNPINIKYSHLDVNDVIPFVMLARYSYYIDNAYERKYRHLLNHKSSTVLELETEKNVYETLPLNLSSFLNSGKEYGFVALNFQTEVGHRGENERDREYNTYVQVTDLGITGKFSAEENTIFVTDLKTGKPVEGATVQLRDDDNNILETVTTDKHGIAKTKGWYEHGIKRKNRWNVPRQWAIVQKGDDIAFINSDWGIGLDPWRMNISYDYYQDAPKYRASMFTERGLYKPSEMVYIKGVAREIIKGNWSVGNLENANVTYTVVDSRDREIAAGSTTLNEYGSYVIDVELPEDSPTGYYNIRANCEINGEQIFSTSQSFRVEEFKPLEFETRIWTENKTHYLNDSLTTRLSGWYLFGEPMTDKEVEYNISIDEYMFIPPNNSGFAFTPLRFFEDYMYSYMGHNIANGSGTLDSKGEYTISPRVSTDKDIHAAYVNISASIEGEDSQEVSSRKTVLIHGSSYYFGIRRQGYFIEKDKPTMLQIVAADTEGNRLTGKKAKLQIMHVYWESVKMAESGGRVRWQSEQIKDIIISEDITINGTNNILEYEFTPEATGQYIISVSGVDEKNRKILAEEHLYVVGEGYSPWSMHDDDLLELVVERDNYEVGETAKVLVKSPYQEATAFITVEREYVLETYVTNVSGSTVLVNVPVKSEYLPNVYIGVTLIKGRTQSSDENQIGDREDIGKPAFKLGYASIGVSPREKRLNVAIEKSHAEREPGDELDLSFTVTDSSGKPVQSELMVTVADVGVLNLIGYNTPNWFSHFYGQRSLGVNTTDTRIHIIGQRNYGVKGANPGGDGDEEMNASMSSSMMESINMDLFSFRKNFKSTAFYSGQLLTDENGKVNVSFNLPDNITTFRIMAVAVDKVGNFGANDDIVIVKKNLQISETIPEFAMVDDTFSAGATIYNNSGSDLDVAIKIETENIEIDGGQKVVHVKGGSFEEVRFDFTATNVGIAKVNIAAVGGEFSDGVQTGLFVKVPRTTEAVALFGNTTDDEVIKTIVIPSTNDVYAGAGDIYAYLSPSAFSELGSSVDYLLTYPYGCLEQRMSKVFPIVTSKRLLIDMNIVQNSEEELDSWVVENLALVKDFQNDNGGFSYWTSKNWVSPWLTGYTTFVLLKAKEMGYEVDSEVLSNALSYLKSQARGNYSTTPLYRADYINKASLAFTANVLAMGGAADNSLITSLYNERHLIPFYGLANLLEAMVYANYNAAAIETVKNMILNSMRQDSTTAFFEAEAKYREMYWIHSTSVRDTSAALISLLKATSENETDGKIIRWLTLSQTGGRYNNTQDNVYAFYAMNEYFKKYESVSPSYKASIIASGKTLIENTFASRNDPSVASMTALDEFEGRGEQRDLIINRDGEGRLYYGIRMSYAPKTLDKARDNGIKVEKTFTTMDGQVVSNGKFVQGQNYKVNLKITMPYERRFVVVDSPIAGGFQILNASFATESDEVKEATGGSSGYWSFNHTENYFDRIILSGDLLTTGVHTYTFVVRAVTPGQYLLPSTKSEEMYNPDVFGYDEQLKIEIVPN